MVIEQKVELCINYIKKVATNVTLVVARGHAFFVVSARALA